MITIESFVFVVLHIYIPIHVTKGWKLRIGHLLALLYKVGVVIVMLCIMVLSFDSSSHGTNDLVLILSRRLLFALDNNVLFDLFGQGFVSICIADNIRFIIWLSNINDSGLLLCLFFLL